VPVLSSHIISFLTVKYYRLVEPILFVCLFSLFYFAQINWHGCLFARKIIAPTKWRRERRIVPEYASTGNISSVISCKHPNHYSMFATQNRRMPPQNGKLDVTRHIWKVLSGPRTAVRSRPTLKYTNGDTPGYAPGLSLAS